MKYKLLALIAVVSIGCSFSACTTTPEQHAAVEALVDLGVEEGAIKPGTAILIKKSTVIISNLLKKEAAKEVPLAGSPVENAVKQGALSTGETLVSYDGVNATVIPPAPDPQTVVP
jgi:hypothetical protein